MAKLNDKYFYKICSLDMLQAATTTTFFSDPENNYGEYYFLNSVHLNSVLRNQLLNESHVVRFFPPKIVHFKKERKICRSYFVEKILSHAIFACIGYKIESHYIANSYACIKRKGQHLGALNIEHDLKRLSHNLTIDVACYKGDIHDYFMSIPHSKLKQILRKYISPHKGKKLLNLLYSFIDVYWDYIDENGEKYGIPIGWYTSEMFSNMYLNELDHFVVETFVDPETGRFDKEHFEFHRFADDFVFLDNLGEKHCIESRKLIDSWINSNLLLELNWKSRITINRVKFCGFRIYRNHIRVKMDVVKAEIARCHEYMNDGDIFKTIRSINSFYGYMKIAKSYTVMARMVYNIFKPYYDLGTDNWYEYYKKCVAIFELPDPYHVLYGQEKGYYTKLFKK